MVLMRVLGHHIKALERQVHESVLIEKLAEKEEECLNLKSEWAGTKIPGLRVSNPKGLIVKVDSREEADLAYPSTMKQLKGTAKD